jgi:DNA-binding MarR family transcriptional regulator
MNRSSLKEIELALERLSSRENRGELYQTLATRAGVDLPPRSVWLLYRLSEHPACTATDLARQLKVDPVLIAPGVEGLVAAGMVEARSRDGDHDLHVTPRGADAMERLTEARRSGLTELLEGWNPEEHPEVIEMVKDLAHELLADDERLVADAMPHAAAAAASPD